MIDLITEIERLQQEADMQRRMQEQQRIIEQRMMQQNQQQQGSGGPPGMSFMQNIFGGGAEAGAGGAGAGGAEAGAGGAGSAGGMGAAGMGGIIAAAIALQHGLSSATDTEVDGVKTDDAFGGHFGTEPWLAFLHDKLDLGPTAGEEFDAAVDNKDWGKALNRAPAMANYWADPLSTWAGTAAEAIGGKTAGKVFNPVASIIDWLS